MKSVKHLMAEHDIDHRQDDQAEDQGDAHGVEGAAAHVIAVGTTSTNSLPGLWILSNGGVCRMLKLVPSGVLKDSAPTGTVFNGGAGFGDRGTRPRRPRPG
jgi:hypothetical protein